MFRNLSIGARLTLSFVLIIFLTGLVSSFSLLRFNRLQAPLTEHIPHRLKTDENFSRLGTNLNEVLLLIDEMAEAAHQYVATNDRKWKYRYQELKPQVDRLLSQLIVIAEGKRNTALLSIDQNYKLVAETQVASFKALEDGNAEKAREYLEGVVYWRLFDELKNKIKNFLEELSLSNRIGASDQISLNEMIRHTQEIVRLSMRDVIGFTILAILFALLFGYLISRKIAAALGEVQKGAEIIGKGDLNYRIPVVNHDEIGHLADDFNQMAQKLHDSYSQLEVRVKEKTHDLEMALNHLELEKSRIEATLNGIGEGVITMDKEGKILMLNPHALEILGCKEEDVKGKNFERIIQCTDESGKEVAYVKRTATLALATGRPVAGNAYYAYGSNERFPVAITVSPVTLEGQIIGAVETFRDISREKEIDQMKSEFISVVSHELRTPLTVIRESLSLVLDRTLGQISQEQEKFLQIARQDLDRLNRMVNGLLDVSKLETGKADLERDNINLSLIVHEVAENFRLRAEKKGIHLEVHSSGARPITLMADRDKMVQVMTNLIGNAVKFTEKGAIRISLTESDKWIDGTVMDSGPGIAREDIPRVFGKFQQLNIKRGAEEKGSGLGLAITKGIIQLHGGKIWVESELGQGSTFHFAIPKLTEEENFERSLNRGIRRSLQAGIPLSVFAVCLNESRDAAQDALYQATKKSLRQASDAVFKKEEMIVMVLSGITGDTIISVKSRIEKYYKMILKDSQLPAWNWSSAVYPADGTTARVLVETAISRLRMT